MSETVFEQRDPPARMRARATGVVVLVALAHSVIQAVFFPAPLRPDEWRAMAAFADALFGGDMSAPAEFFLRQLLMLANLVGLLLLYRLRLIDGRVIVFALVWPMTIFLMTRIYWDAWIFLLCLVRTDLAPRREALLLTVLLGLVALTGEGNLIVLLVFRGIVLAQRLGRPVLAPLGFAGVCIGLSWALSSGVAGEIPGFGDLARRFRWTREVANPEYSVVETVGVLLSSLHFFTLHTARWWIDAGFSIVALGAILSSAEARERLWARRHVALAIACVIAGFTELTHVFQNARYYFFVVPLLAAITPSRLVAPLAGLGILHVLLKVLVSEA